MIFRGPYSSDHEKKRTQIDVAKETIKEMGIIKISYSPYKLKLHLL